jgi:recombination protein RecA
MPSAAALRLEIEHALERRFPAALTPAPRTIHEVCATGIEAVDGLLGGGLPVGAISELTGSESSGRTSLALAFVAGRTREDRPCAWVDVDDALDPQSAAANGVRLRQLLWVRCKSRERATPANKNHSPGAPAGNKGTNHPSEPRPLAGGPGRKQVTPVESDQASAQSKPPQISWAKPDWTRLDQALRATDLLLQAGGFAAIVLDLGDTAPQQANRIPAATWFRYRQAAERTRCCLVVVGQRAYARSAAAVALECEPARATAAGDRDARGTVLRGFEFVMRRGRERFAPIEIGTRKPVAATWQAGAAWDAEQARA